jgi:flagellar capping protein FliD
MVRVMSFLGGGVGASPGSSAVDKGEAMKHLTAVIAALGMTTIVGVAMLGIGLNAMANRNVVPTQDSPAASTAAQIPAASSAQLQQMQSLIQQYQARDQQYQSQLSTVVQQLNQRNAQLQQFTQLLLELQNRGLILIQPDGTILIPRG